MAKDIEQPAATEGEPTAAASVDDLRRALSEERKRSAGLDRKVNELVRDLEEMRGTPDDRLSQAEALAKAAGELKARAAAQDRREKAYAYAREKGISPALAEVNADHLEEFVGEVDKLHEDIKRGLMETARTRPGSIERAKGLDLARIGRMKPEETALIPESIRRRFMESE